MTLARWRTSTATTASEKGGRGARCACGGACWRPSCARRGPNAASAMGFGTLEDLEGSFDLVIFSDPYNQHARALAGGEGRRRRGDETEGRPGPAADLGEPRERATRRRSWCAKRDASSATRRGEAGSTQLEVQPGRGRCQSRTSIHRAAKASSVSHPGDCVGGRPHHDPRPERDGGLASGGSAGEWRRPRGSRKRGRRALRPAAWRSWLAVKGARAIGRKGRQMRIRGRAVACVLAGLGLACGSPWPGAGHAEVRRLEAVGMAIPIGAGRAHGPALGITEPSSRPSARPCRGSPTQMVIEAGPTRSRSELTRISSTDWLGLLGQRALPYTTRFRILEDRGTKAPHSSGRPAIRGGPGEYVVRGRGPRRCRTGSPIPADRRRGCPWRPRSGCRPGSRTLVIRVEVQGISWSTRPTSDLRERAH